MFCRETGPCGISSFHVGVSTGVPSDYSKHLFLYPQISVALTPHPRSFLLCFYQWKTITEIHKSSKFRELLSVGYTVPANISTMQPVYLRLREHCRRGIAKIGKGRAQRPLLWYSVVCIWQPNFLWFLKASKRTLHEKNIVSAPSFSQKEGGSSMYPESINVLISFLFHLMCMEKWSAVILKWSNHITICSVPFSFVPVVHIDLISKCHHLLLFAYSLLLLSTFHPSHTASYVGLDIYHFPNSSDPPRSQCCGSCPFSLG